MVVSEDDADTFHTRLLLVGLVSGVERQPGGDSGAAALGGPDMAVSAQFVGALAHRHEAHAGPVTRAMPRPSSTTSRHRPDGLVDTATEMTQLPAWAWWATLVSAS